MLSENRSRSGVQIRDYFLFHCVLGRRGRDRMIVGFTTTYAFSAYQHERCEFESHSGEVYLIQHYVIKVCLWLATGLWFSPGTPVSSTNKTGRHDITEILLKVAFFRHYSITLTPPHCLFVNIMLNVVTITHSMY